MGEIISGDRRLDLTALEAGATRAAAGLASLGVGPGDLIALYLRNDIAFYEASMAAGVVGAYPTPVNWHYAPTEDAAAADVAVFNTCCVRDNADQKVYGAVGHFKTHKENNPEQVLVISGCLAQKDGEEFVSRFPQVDVVVGTHNLADIPELVERVQQGTCRE